MAPFSAIFSYAPDKFFTNTTLVYNIPFQDWTFYWFLKEELSKKCQVIVTTALPNRAMWLAGIRCMTLVANEFEELLGLDRFPSDIGSVQFGA